MWRARPLIWPTFSARPLGERPLRDLPFGVRIVDAAAWSCQDERRQQTSCAADLEWRARGSCTTARLHSNPSIALTPALANSFRLREAAVAMAGGGDAGDAKHKAPGGSSRWVDRCSTCLSCPGIRASDTPLPYRPRTLRWTTRSRSWSPSSCAPRVFRRASQGPQGRVVPLWGVQGKA